MRGAMRSIMFAAAILWLAGAARAELAAPGAKVEKLGTGYKFTEGPAADKAGNVYFTDIPNARIHKWALDGKITLVRENTNAANGLYFDKDGNLLACEGGAGRVTKMDASGKVTPIAENLNGKPFNSPNDLWIDPKGGVYFTDPRYGDESNLPQGSQQVYYIAPGGKGVTRATEDLKKPNGIIGTPDGKILYVADHGAKKTWKYATGADGKLGNKTEFIQSGSDGMTLDEKGNLYLTTERVEVYDPSGKKIQDIEIPEVPANVTFGGADRKTLFLTARTSVYSLKMSVRGVSKRVFIYTDLVREAIADIAATVPAFAHLDAGRIAVACAARWAGSKWGNLATCIGLADRSEPAFTIWARRRSRVVTQVSPWHRRESARIVFHGAECRYLVLLRMPRHLEHDPLDTVVHELFHIGESFDDRLRAMRHGRIFDWHVNRLAREWRAKGSPALVASLEMTLPQLLARHGAVHAHRMPGDFHSGRIVAAEAPCSYEEGLARLYPKFRFAAGGYRMGPPPKFDPPSARIHFTERDRTLRRFVASGASDLSPAAERYLSRASRISFPAFVDDSMPLG